MIFIKTQAKRNKREPHTMEYFHSKPVYGQGAQKHNVYSEGQQEHDTVKTSRGHPQASSPVVPSCQEHGNRWCVFRHPRDTFVSEFLC